MRITITVTQRSISTAYHNMVGTGGETKARTDETAFAISPPETNKTMLSTEDITPPPVIPPRLVVNESGKEPWIVTLTADRVSIGRQEDNDIVLENRYISRHHASLEKRGQDYYIIPAQKISNPLLLDSQPVMDATRLEHGAKIRLGGYELGELFRLISFPLRRKDSRSLNLPRIA